MATLTVKVSWGKEKYDIALDAAGDVLSFKAQLQSLTGVSAERQKISEWSSVGSARISYTAAIKRSVIAAPIRVPTPSNLYAPPTLNPTFSSEGDHPFVDFKFIIIAPSA